MFNPEIQITADGSHTLFIPEIEEHYHSVNGAIQESLHVYIEAGLNHSKKHSINVLEYGFGTGLNAFLTSIEAEKRNLNIKYTSLEKYPLPNHITTQLNYTKEFSDKFQKYFEEIHACNWKKCCQISNNFQIEKIQTDFSEFQFKEDYDVIFYDAFAPDKQSDVWSQTIFNSIFEHTKPEGILTTYCAKGNIRRMLLSAGFQVERIPGPPGKREMLRAIKMVQGTG